MPPKRAGKVIKKVAQNVIHPPYMRFTIPAGKATAGPPLGPNLGQIGIQIGPFCKKFNEMTSTIKEGIPIPTDVLSNPDRTFSITLHKPPTSYLLKQAAGIQKGSTGKEDVAGKVTLKHIYEIAKVKIEDPAFRGKTLEETCKQIIGTSHTLGIEIVKSLEPEEYREFLEERGERLEQFELELEEVRKSKLLRL